MESAKHKNQRIAIFIDVQNLYHSARSIYDARVNFKNLLEDAVAGRQLIRAFAYVISTKTGEEKPFFEALAALGIEIREKPLQEFFGGAKKADWDVGLAIDAVRIAPGVDTIVICSGDGDFIPLVDYLKINQGKRVEVASFERSTSSALIESVDDFVDLGAARKYLIKRRAE
jgi:uncharacterized LabA/DUF88 family protein